MWCFVVIGILFTILGLIVLTTNADRAWANMARRQGGAAERTPQWDARYRTGRFFGGGSMLIGGVGLLAWSILRIVLGAKL